MLKTQTPTRTLNGRLCVIDNVVTNAQPQVESNKNDNIVQEDSSFLVQTDFKHNLLVPDIWLEGTLIKRYYENKINVKVISYNCKNIKPSLNVIEELCSTCDILLLQETWLYNFHLSICNFMHKDFYGKGICH